MRGESTKPTKKSIKGRSALENRDKSISFTVQNSRIAEWEHKQIYLRKYLSEYLAVLYSEVLLLYLNLSTHKKREHFRKQ